MPSHDLRCLLRRPSCDPGFLAIDENRKEHAYPLLRCARPPALSMEDARRAFPADKSSYNATAGKNRLNRTHPSRFSAEARPWCKSMIERTIASPRPVELADPVRASSIR